MDVYTLCNWVLMFGATVGLLLSAAVGWSVLFCWAMSKVGDMFGGES